MQFFVERAGGRRWVEVDGGAMNWVNSGFLTRKKKSVGRDFQTKLFMSSEWMEATGIILMSIMIILDVGPYYQCT